VGVRLKNPNSRLQSSDHHFAIIKSIEIGLSAIAQTFIFSVVSDLANLLPFRIFPPSSVQTHFVADKLELNQSVNYRLRSTDKRVAPTQFPNQKHGLKVALLTSRSPPNHARRGNKRSTMALIMDRPQIHEPIPNLFSSCEISQDHENGFSL
jgi:hypothetical protein